MGADATKKRAVEDGDINSDVLVMPPFSKALNFESFVPTVCTVGYKYGVGVADLFPGKFDLSVSWCGHRLTFVEYYTLPGQR